MQKGKCNEKSLPKTNDTTEAVHLRKKVNNLNYNSKNSEFKKNLNSKKFIIQKKYGRTFQKKISHLKNENGENFFPMFFFNLKIVANTSLNVICFYFETNAIEQIH